ncbi:MAG: hypothetical protein IJE08_07465 [Clostridia bacterium]|nr:hypothetical protein [Clostridia bacterium]
MKFKEPQVEFIRLNLAERVFSASPVICQYDATKCTDLEAGGYDLCVNSGSKCDIEAMLEDYSD